MLNKKKKKEGKKMKRQPSFSLPRNPYRYKYGARTPGGPMVGSWTALSRSQQGLAQSDLRLNYSNGLMCLNAQIAQDLSMAEINEWMTIQKVGDGDDLWITHSIEDLLLMLSSPNVVTTVEG